MTGHGSIPRSIRSRSKQIERGKPMTQRLMTQTLTETTSWQALQTHYEKIKDIQLRKLFADDPTRGERMSNENVALPVDYSKPRITDETLRLLIQLANERARAARRDAMVRGEKGIVTEKRALLHVALR